VLFRLRRNGERGYALAPDVHADPLSKLEE